MKGNTYTLACWVCFSSPFAEAKITFTQKNSQRREGKADIFIIEKIIFESSS